MKLSQYNRGIVEGLKESSQVKNRLIEVEIRTQLTQPQLSS